MTIFGENRIELLMNYVEADILDSHKQATAFDLIKAIIGRQVENSKVYSLRLVLITK
jgi:hypothetical protein